MVVEVDIDMLIDNKLTAHDWIVAKLIKEEKFIYLTTYLDQTGQDGKEVTKKLVNAKLIKDYNDPLSDKFYTTRLEATPKLQNILMKGDFFDEFVSKYPVKVIRPDGLPDYLRTDLSRSRRIYNKLTNNSRVKHNHILRCLEFEVDERTRTHKLAYMKRLPKWLAAKEYETYEQAMMDQKVEANGKPKSDTKYGETIL
jgi:hypothetical protein